MLYSVFTNIQASLHVFLGGIFLKDSFIFDRLGKDVDKQIDNRNKFGFFIAGVICKIIVLH